MRIIKKIIFTVGTILIILNLCGVLLNLRNEDIYNERQNKFGIELREAHFYKELDYIFNSSATDSSKIVATTYLVNKGLAHYWKDEGIHKYNLTIPLYENYLLWLGSYVFPKRYQKYEFFDYRKAIERGVGLCSQLSIIQTEILKEKGINSKIIGLSGHVIATAEYSPNKWIIVDPDYGVNIPFDIKTIESNTKLIEKYYHYEGYDSLLVATLKEFYNSEGNQIHNDAFSYSPRKALIEIISYWFIWIIPIFMILPFKKIKLFKHGT
tara:strand:+ start:72 stop:872 length:801 start_codon:yes stop_codon:yes gene_type:complete